MQSWGADRTPATALIVDDECTGLGQWKEIGCEVGRAIPLEPMDYDQRVGAGTEAAVVQARTIRAEEVAVGRHHIQTAPACRRACGEGERQTESEKPHRAHC